MPAASILSMNFGLMPVGCNCPMILPSWTPCLLKDEEVLHDDGVPFHALHLCYLHYFAGAVPDSLQMDDKVTSRGDELADSSQGKIHTHHQHHGLQAADGVAGAVRVGSGKGSIVASVHGLEHVQGFPSLHLTGNDAVGVHTQGIDHQLSDGDLALTLRTSRLQGCHMFLLQLKLSRVLDGDNALVGGMKAERTLRKVVLPEPLPPPETTMLSRASTQVLNGKC